MAKFKVIMKEKSKGFGAKKIDFAIPENIYRGFMDVLGGKAQIVPIQEPVEYSAPAQEEVVQEPVETE